jgi:hypothetical protein
MAENDQREYTPNNWEVSIVRIVRHIKATAAARQPDAHDGISGAGQRLRETAPFLALFSKVPSGPLKE